MRRQSATSKTDPCQLLVSELLRQSNLATLWITDENLGGQGAVSGLNSNTLQALSNRIDVANKLNQQGLACTFNDVDLSIFTQPFEQIIYRLSKEKAVIHRVMNQAYQQLSDTGELILVGQKNDGIKRFAKNAEALFTYVNTEKNGTCYVARCRGLKTSPQALDDDNYTRIRQIKTLPDILGNPVDIYSKPGAYGWEKIDQGSVFLIEQLNLLNGDHINKSGSMLDLGCGYGYLTLITKSLPFTTRIATDNNAAALLALKENIEANDIKVTAVAADCAESITDRVDLVLCNPPFHQGFQVDGALTDKFLRQARQHLNKQGKALFVVNAFIPLEKKARQYFSQADVIADNKQFKVVLLTP